MKINKKKYYSPKITVFSNAVEQGFSASFGDYGDAGDIFDIEDNGEF